jgi:hypothetical protein
MSIPAQAQLALLLVLGACAQSETYGFVAVLGNDTTSSTLAGVLTLIRSRGSDVVQSAQDLRIKWTAHLLRSRITWSMLLRE